MTEPKTRNQEPDWLYVELERSGGQVPTLRPRFKVEARNLTAEERKRFDLQLGKASFFDQPPRFSKTGHPDTFEYRLTVAGASRSHTVVFHDDDGHPESLDAIIEWIRAHRSQ